MKSVRLACLILALAAAGTAATVACVQVEARQPDSPSPTPTTLSDLTPTPTETSSDQTPEATLTPTAGPDSTPPASPTVSLTTTPTEIPVNGVGRFGLYLEVEGLGVDNTVYGDTVVIKGQTSPDAVVSINTVIVPVDAEGRFEMALRLPSGASEIVVVASNLNGEVEDEVIDIVSLPESEGSV